MEPNDHPPAQHRAPMASYAMADLRAEINRRRGGKDNRITIERQCERRQNIKGTTLRKISTLMRQYLWMVVWPHKFQLHLPEKYDGTINPTEFLQI
jgi:hypothetical protein